MARIYPRWMAAGILAAATRMAAAQSIEFDVQPRAVQVGEAAVASLTLRGIPDASGVSLPAIPDFDVQPMGQQSRTSWVNGQVDQSVVCNFALIPRKPGKFLIGPFQFDIGSKTYDVPACPVQVTPAGAPGDGTAAGGAAMFATLSSDAESVYVNQAANLTLSLYLSSDMRVAGNVNLVGFPETGLKYGRIEELPATRVEREGRLYSVRRYRLQLRPQAAGTYEFADTALRVTVLDRPRQPADPFGGSSGDPLMDLQEALLQQMGSMQIQVNGLMLGGGRPMSVPVQPFRLVVKDVPAEGRPADFANAVGRYQMDVQIKPTDVAAGEPITAQIVLAGEGNLENVAAPAFKETELLRAYAPKLTDERVDSEGGSKRFEQVVLPRDAALKELPAVTFSYFDPDAGRYVTLARGPFPVKVRPAPATPPGGAAVIAAAPNVAAPSLVRGADIVDIKPAPRRWIRARGDEAWPPAAWLFAAAPALALAIAWGWRRRRDALDRDVARARREQAPRAARAALRRAGAAIRAGDALAAHSALWEAVADYFGHRLNLPPGDVTPARALEVAGQAGLSETDREDFRRILEQGEAVRFGGGAAGDLAPALQTVTRVLQTCERRRV